MPESIFLSPRPDDPDAGAAGDSGASEFLSEASAEFEALKRSSEPRRVPLLRDAPVPQSVTLNPAPAADVVRLEPPFRPPSRPLPMPVRWPWLLAVVVPVLAIPAWFLVRQAPGQAAPESAMPPPAPAAASVAAPEPPAAATSPGTVIVESNPPGAEVSIDGEARGVTPLRLSLVPGTYTAELRQAGVTKTIAITVEAGTTLRESIELPPATIGTGRLSITSDTAGARVTLDGRPVGVTPLSLAGVAPGAHRVAVTAGGQTVTRSVTVERGATASVYLATPASAATGGWVNIEVPFEMRVMERDQVIGTTSAPRIMLPVGRHELELSATRFDFRTGIVVDIQAGETATVQVPVPNGRLSLNAVPWADVWIDGQAVGQTPIANLAVPIGVHAVVFRHPQFGERQLSVTVALETPARAGVDMTTAR